MGIVTGPVRPGDGVTPAVALVDPKFPHNVGAAVRAASCYGPRRRPHLVPLTPSDRGNRRSFVSFGPSEGPN